MVGQDVSTVGRGAIGRKPRSLSAGRDPRFGARFVLRIHPIASATAHALTRLTSGTETTRPSRNSTTSARSVTRTFRAAAAVAVGTFEVVMPCLGEFGLVLSSDVCDG